jgi:hypothetical protein
LNNEQEFLAVDPTATVVENLSSLNNNMNFQQQIEQQQESLAAD